MSLASLTKSSWWQKADRALTWLIGRDKEAILFILPLLFFFGVFRWYPVANTIRLSFMNYELLRPDRIAFVGLQNYLEWVRDPRMHESAWVAIKYTLIYVPVSTVYALIAALFLDRVRKARIATAFRVMLYFPVVLPASIIFLVWKWMYDPALGVFNHILVDIMGVAWPWPGWLLDPNTALPSIALMSIWRLMGVTMMLFLVGLNNIPNELLEAARMDGANELRVISSVILPLLRPIFLVVLVLRLNTLGVIIEPMIMTQGGPVNATMTYGLRAYSVSFWEGNWNIGYGSTWFLMLGIASMVLAYAGYKWLGEKVAER